MVFENNPYKTGKFLAKYQLVYSDCFIWGKDEMKYQSLALYACYQ
jgi:hypothetical protein